ncbi:ribonuclease H2 subunit C-like [Branchiostoma floridae x Branchiostoma belcheri]
MSVEVDLSGVSGETAAAAKLHLLPCEVEHTGPAQVARFFTPGVRDSGQGALQASFRGRELRGENVTLPDGYTGLVLKEKHKAVSDEEARVFHAAQKFQEFTYWNMETPPSKNDGLQKALHWLEISKAIHSPVDKNISQNGSHTRVKVEDSSP